jgi:hypothetical protein
MHKQKDVPTVPVRSPGRAEFVDDRLNTRISEHQTTRTTELPLAVAPHQAGMPLVSACASACSS